MDRKTDRTGAVTAASVAAALALTGCGTTKARGTATSTTPSPPATASPSTQPRPIGTALRRLQDAVCGTRRPEPSPTSAGPSPTVAIPEDRPPDHGDNNAYRRALPLTGLSACRGDVHVHRLVKGLKSTAADKPAVDAALSRLGYGDEVERLQVAGSNVEFTLGLDGVCVTGTLTPGHRNTIEAHGPYLEGGCVEPEYGH